MSTERKLYTQEQTEARKNIYIYVEIFEAECVEILTPN
jgi:hypothetical protein